MIDASIAGPRWPIYHPTFASIPDAGGMPQGSRRGPTARCGYRAKCQQDWTRHDRTGWSPYHHEYSSRHPIARRRVSPRGPTARCGLRSATRTPDWGGFRIPRGGRVTVITEYSVPTPGSEPAHYHGGTRRRRCGLPSSMQIRLGASQSRAVAALPSRVHHSNGLAAVGQYHAGPDGALWFTEGSANQIGRITIRAMAALPSKSTLFQRPVAIRRVSRSDPTARCGLREGAANSDWTH